MQARGSGRCDERRHDFAETRDIGTAAHRQEFAVAPEATFRAPRQRILTDGVPQRLEVIAHRQRFACRGQTLRHIRGVTRAGCAALEMGRERREFLRGTLCGMQPE
jgi:hypothetical protein